MVDESVRAQIRVIHRVVDVLTSARIGVWLFGGWGLDARIGRISRSHGDIEFWVARYDSANSRPALVSAGATELATQPPEEACEFTLEGVNFSTAYFDRKDGGSFYQPLGRWPDWVFPPASFGDDPGSVDGVSVPVMSVAGMLAMKEQFPTLRNGRPWREKDISDIEILRRLSSQTE